MSFREPKECVECGEEFYPEDDEDHCSPECEERDHYRYEER